MKRLTINAFFMMLAFGVWRPAQAIDTDLFISNPVISGTPNLLVIWNNGANWSANMGGRTKRALISQAVHLTLCNLKNDTAIRLGFMGHSSSNSPRGGKIHFKVQDWSESYKATLLNYLFAEQPNGVVADAAAGTVTMGVSDNNGDGNVNCSDIAEQDLDNDGVFEFNGYEDADGPTAPVVPVEDLTLFDGIATATKFASLSEPADPWRQLAENFSFPSISTLTMQVARNLFEPASAAPPDDDGDGVKNQSDNCPNTPNAAQTDSDGDGIGDACDADTDGDGVDDIFDLCPSIFDDQTDTDGDGDGDACDADDDGDGVLDGSDNCPATFGTPPNPDQTDTDGDGVGDLCDIDEQDADNDGVPNGTDNCPAISNAAQTDSDGDGFGAACDSNDADPSDGGGTADADGDFDLNNADNCPFTANASQADGDGDGIGDACDAVSTAQGLYCAGQVGSDPNVCIEKTNNQPIATTFLEAYKYFAGDAVRSGLGDDDNTENDTPGEDFIDETAIDGAGNYISPIEAGNECGSNFIVFFGTGAPDSGENSEAETALAGLGGVIGSDPISYGDVDTDQFEANWADEYARYFAANDVNSDVDEDQFISTYVIDVFDPTDNSATADDQRAYMQSIAAQGNGRYFEGTDADSVAEAFNEIISEVIAVNTVFAASALPVSVNVRGTNLNQVYLGVFRPDEGNKPTWRGNLKLYQLGLDASGNVRLEDQNDQAARDPTSGFISSSAQSFWTDTTSYWDYITENSVEAGISLESDNPDGAIVEKGGVAQDLRTPNPATVSTSTVDNRSVYTCNSGCSANDPLSSSPFTTANLTVAEEAVLCSNSTNCTNDAGGALFPLLGTAVSDMVNWIRGEDVFDARFGTGSTGNGVLDEPRPGIHGDVLHSRPVVVNYNRNGTDDDVVVFYGTNGGTLHAIQGGTADPAGGLPVAGSELWAFIAPEHYPSLGQLYDDESLGASTVDRKIYFDGPIAKFEYDVDPTLTAAQNAAKRGGDGKLVHTDCSSDDATDCDKVILFVTMRRGGDMIYAFDVSNPANPKFLWKKLGPDVGDGVVDGDQGTTANADTGFMEMGQTWSEPKVTFLTNTNLDLNNDGSIGLDLDGDGIRETDEGNLWPVLVMGKGYDPVNDDTNVASVDTVGTGIMVLRAIDGSLIWQVGPDDPSDASFPGVPAGSVYLQNTNMQHSIPSDVTIIDRGNLGTGGARDGFTDFGYVGDTGGNIWKISFLDSDGDGLAEPADWTVSWLAALGNHADVDTSNDRRFLFPPDVIVGPSDGSTELPSDSCGAFDAVLIGSGDREDPFGTSVVDRFYMIKDRDTPGNVLDASCDNLEDPIRDPADRPTLASGDPTPYSDVFQADGSTASPEGGDDPTTAYNALIDASDAQLDDQDFYDVTSNQVQDGGLIYDRDGDGVSDELDNCVSVSNETQDDADNDGTGDACDNDAGDSDGDGVNNGTDNCPDVNNDQTDTDADGLGDLCDSDTDSDGDGVDDLLDNCLAVANGVAEDNQADTNSDNVGDACSTGTEGVSEAAAALDLANGWYLELLNGEKVVSSSITLGGVVFFNTNQPGSEAACGSDLGVARSYALDFFDGSAGLDTDSDGDLDGNDRFVTVAGGGFPPNPVPATVILDGQEKEVVLIGTLIGEPPGTPYNVREKIFWYQEIDEN